MKTFENNIEGNGIPISIKIRADYGCFDKSCCLNAFKIIDSEIYKSRNQDYKYVKHESGPELLVVLGLTAAGLSLAKSIIDLVTVIIKARFEGQKLGDNHKHDPVSLIVRRIEKPNEVIEEKVFTFSENDKVDTEIISKLLNDSCKKITQKSDRK
jgi:hypothetical protein